MFWWFGGSPDRTSPMRTLLQVLLYNDAFLIGLADWSPYVGRSIKFVRGPICSTSKQIPNQPITHVSYLIITDHPVFLELRAFRSELWRACFYKQYVDTVNKLHMSTPMSTAIFGGTYPEAKGNIIAFRILLDSVWNIVLKEYIKCPVSFLSDVWIAAHHWEIPASPMGQAGQRPIKMR
mgnify:CR=1 FL=1